MSCRQVATQITRMKSNEALCSVLKFSEKNYHILGNEVFTLELG